MGSDKTLSQLTNVMTSPSDATAAIIHTNEGNIDYKMAMSDLLSFVNGSSTTKTASYTITDTDTESLYICNNTANAKMTMTLPTAADNTNKVITFTKGNANYGTVVIDGEGAETINSWSSIVLFRQYETVKLISDGTGWVIINDWKWYIEAGMISRLDWSNVHLGFIELVGTISGTFELWETVTDDTDSHRGIVIDINAGSLSIIWTDDGSGGVGGYFQNLAVATGQTSSATITLTADTKDVDSNIVHNLGLSYVEMDVNLVCSTDGTESGIADLNIDNITTNIRAHQFTGVSTSEIKLQTANAGVGYSLTDAGATVSWSSVDYYYTITVGNK